MSDTLLDQTSTALDKGVHALFAMQRSDGVTMTVDEKLARM